MYNLEGQTNPTIINGPYDNEITSFNNLSKKSKKTLFHMGVIKHSMMFLTHRANDLIKSKHTTYASVLYMFFCMYSVYIFCYVDNIYFAVAECKIKKI